MTEVFSISGASFGATTKCPVGFTASGSNCKGSAAVPLQSALKALGTAVGGDTSLTKLTVDGVVGPGTAAAVNHAFTVHIGAGQAPENFRTGDLSIEDVAADAAQLTSLINAEITRRGGALAPTSALVPTSAPARAPLVPTTYLSPVLPTAMIPGVAPSTAPAGDIAGLPPKTWALIGLVGIAVVSGVYMIVRAHAAGAGARVNPLSGWDEDDDHREYMSQRQRYAAALPIFPDDIYQKPKRRRARTMPVVRGAAHGR